MKARGVFRAVIRRRQHAAQHHRDLACLQSLDDVGQRSTRQIGVDAAQRVVGAELDDHAVGSVRDRPVEPVTAAGRGISGHARIGHLDRYAFGLQGFLKFCGECVLGREAEASAQGIAENDQLDRLCRFGPCRIRHRHQSDHQHGYVHEESVTPLDRVCGVAI
ncbi:hypothetical protein ACVWZ3_008994 [Bradyrhizobium sp. i1.3.6]